MIIKFIIVLLLVLFTVSDLRAAVYKCTSDSGKIAYSDRPCVNSDNENVIAVSKHKPSWLEQLRTQKPFAIKIVTVTGGGNDVTIEYTFRTQSDSAKFMKKASELSAMTVVLKKVILASETTLGTAIIQVSDKKIKAFSALRGK